MKKIPLLISFILLQTFSSFAQTRILKGTVVNEKGTPLTAATVMLYKNFRYGTSTNKRGEFSLKIPSNYNDSVRVTYRGYEDNYETIQGNDSINFVLSVNKAIQMNFVKEQTIETTQRKIWSKPKKEKKTNVKQESKEILIKPVEDLDMVFTRVEINAEFQGGRNKLKTYFENAIQYPDTATIKNVDGTVVAGFTITKDGYVTNIKIVKGVNEFANDCVLNALLKMPRWTPAIQNGYTIEQYFEFAFEFKIKNIVTIINDTN